ncbi:fatty acyl-CoA reductase 1-like [Nymphalis io]|uniref:fatty acyl-CoA reductase 1-like n=1 Tax=Inachis io TaxID=171585 RepID=UPI002166CBFD|nr:fatty acyl-CoA reductase 1-like [Nymphalis io]XP_050358526.1 fatty acyl-CoA reductase 1-like [Nymphalis io]XP_050358527.1 fatty acyl-CoA reductase 1-like [Nymphalis io]XP_050358528.1 fatty acyl-CoA reductase 1-like [Nymphalis io]XP_050358529.1 fatty acyl-CoA reductase 1-like [Nymphalis io]
MGFLDDRDLENVPSIQEYYKGKTIFITGGSGFMGKVLVEKLLYSCSDLDRIYLLLRNKKGVKPEDRLADIYASKCFDRLRKEKPDIFQEKVFFIAGDASEIGLGISDEDRTLIINRTNILFHVAASVRFDDSLKVAARLNLRGTREIVELAKDIRNLEVLVHVSTSYANTNRKQIDEVIYPAFADWRETLNICENVDDHTLNVLTPKYLGELPNTYVFTKQLAEHVMTEQKGKLPIVIMRPSIVISSASEPLVGWVENLNGPVGILVASGKGILRTLYTDPDILSDYIPVDVAIKAFIAGAWARGVKKLEPTDDIEVYNCSTSHMKTMTIGEIVDFGKNCIVREIPLEGMLWSVGGSVTRSQLEYYLKVLFLHLLPAILVDLVLRITGNKPMLVKVQRRIYVANLALQYFVTQQWTFTNKNILELRSRIKNEDKVPFYYEMETIIPEEFFRNACIGGKEFILNERMENLPKAKAHFRRMELLDRVVRTIIQGYLFWFIVNTEFVTEIFRKISNLTV